MHSLYRQNEDLGMPRAQCSPPSGQFGGKQNWPKGVGDQLRCTEEASNQKKGKKMYKYNFRIKARVREIFLFASWQIV